MLSPSRRKEMAIDVADRGGAGERAREAARQEIEAAERRIETMRAEQAEVGRRHRAQRAAMEKDIAKQEAAITRWSQQVDAVVPTPSGHLDLVNNTTSVPPDRDRVRVALLDRDEAVVGTLGDRPSGFSARELWIKNAMSIVSAIPTQPEPAHATPDIDDLGPEL